MTATDGSAPGRGSPRSPTCWTSGRGRRGCGSSCDPNGPIPGAQLPVTDVDGHRVTAFATNTTRGQLADLELRHRRRARCEDRIRAAKATGLRNFPLHDFAQNRISLAVVTLAQELLAWAGLLALTDHPARRWEPKRLRLGLLSIAATLASRSRQTWLRLSRTAPWTPLLLHGLTRLAAVPDSS